MNNKNKELSEELLDTVSGGAAGVMYKGYFVMNMTLVDKQYCSNCDFNVFAFLDEKADHFDVICTECQQKIKELPFK